MTYTIPQGSLKQDRAIRFGKELSRAMKERDVGTRTLSEAIPCGRTAVMYWRTGRILPRIEMARKLAEALDWPKLASLAAQLRRKDCLVCETPFVDDSGSDNRMYCSLSCQKVRGKSVAGVDRRTRAAIAERALRVHQRAVAAYCAACEPSGRCVTPECELRPASPLALYEERFGIDVVTAKPKNGYREPGADSARMARTWAAYTPEEAAQRKARAAEGRWGARGPVPA